MILKKIVVVFSIAELHMYAALKVVRITDN